MKKLDAIFVPVGGGTFTGRISHPHKKYCDVSISNSYVRVYATGVTNSQLATIVRLTGTAHGNSHVGTFTAKIIVGHYQDVQIESMQGFYPDDTSNTTIPTLKVEGDGNGQYTLSMKTATTSAATYYFTIESLSDQTTISTLPSSTASTTISHEHECTPGKNLTHLGRNGQTKIFKIQGDADFIGDVIMDNSGSGDRSLTISTTTGGDPTIIMNSDAANRSGIINFQDNGTVSGAIQYRHNGDIMKFITGGTGTAHEELTLNETTGATFRTRVRVGTSTETANTNFDDLVIENVAGHSGMSIFSKSDSDGAIYFGDVEANNLGQIKYSHGSNAMTFATNDGAASLTLDSGLNATFSGDVMPAAENAHNIGSSAVRWEDIFVDQVYGRSVYIDDYIYHNGDTNTYIRAEADKWTFRTGGDDRMFIEDSKVTITGRTEMADLRLRKAGTSDQTTTTDTTTAPAGGNELIRFEGNYTDGRYSHELVKIDRAVSYTHLTLPTTPYV